MRDSPDRTPKDGWFGSTSRWIWGSIQSTLMVIINSQYLPPLAYPFCESVWRAVRTTTNLEVGREVSSQIKRKLRTMQSGSGKIYEKCSTFYVGIQSHHSSVIPHPSRFLSIWPLALSLNTLVVEIYVLFVFKKILTKESLLKALND